MPAEDVDPVAVVGVASRMLLRISFDTHRAAENYDREEKQRK